MSEFFFEYGLFFAKILTVVVAVVVIIGVAAAAGRNCLLYTSDAADELT